MPEVVEAVDERLHDVGVQYLLQIHGEDFFVCGEIGEEGDGLDLDEGVVPEPLGAYLEDLVVEEVPGDLRALADDVAERVAYFLAELAEPAPVGVVVEDVVHGGDAPGVDEELRLVVQMVHDVGEHADDGGAARPAHVGARLEEGHPALEDGGGHDAPRALLARLADVTGGPEPVDEHLLVLHGEQLDQEPGGELHGLLGGGGALPPVEVGEEPGEVAQDLDVGGVPQQPLPDRDEALGGLRVDDHVPHPLAVPRDVAQRPDGLVHDLLVVLRQHVHQQGGRPELHHHPRLLRGSARDVRQHPRRLQPDRLHRVRVPVVVHRGLLAQQLHEARHHPRVHHRLDRRQSLRRQIRPELHRPVPDQLQILRVDLVPDLQQIR